MARKIRINFAELKTMLEDGMSQKAIADHLGCNPATISREIKRYKELGYPINSQPTGRRVGSTNVPKKPFRQEVYEMIKEIGGFEN